MIAKTFTLEMGARTRLHDHEVTTARQKLIAAGERGPEIYQGSSFLSEYDSSFGGHQ